MPRWTVDYTDSAESILPSFPAIRQKTRETLYKVTDNNKQENSNTDATSSSSSSSSSSIFRDKSPKGSVDEAIQPLVDLINQHSSFATLSSCSGRISLFDPNYHATSETQTEQQQSEPRAQSTVEHGGKGSSGGWVLVSHDPISPEILLDALDPKKHSNDTPHPPDDISSIPWNLQFEPLMLHVAAANLTRGQQLFQLAYSRGFRESGLVVTDTRVTVAIRTTATTLTIPVRPTGPWAVSAEYLRHFVQLANDRLRQTHARIHELFHAFHTECLRGPIPITVSIQSTPNVRIPNLNLWGHTSVYYSDDTRRTAADDDSEQSTDLSGIWVFGGYGVGPQHGQETQKGGARRSKSVYWLAHTTNKACSWAAAWETIDVQSSPTNEDSQDDSIFINGLMCQFASFGPREGLKSILWNNSDDGSTSIQQPTVILFGGRTSPANPLDDLILFDLRTKQFARPCHVKGTPPGPRWGHTFTRIQQQHPSQQIISDSECGTILGVVHGGRNERDTFRDTYVLSFIKDDNGQSSLLWTTVSTKDGGPRLSRPCFHHSTCQIADSRMLVIGGISSASGLLGQSADDGRHVDESLLTCLEWNKSESADSAIAFPDKCILFGHTSHAIPENGHHGDLLLLTGGVSNETDEEPLIYYGLEHTHGKENQASLNSSLSLEKKAVNIHGSGLDFGSLVHHTSHIISLKGSKRKTTEDSSSYELVLLGGGVPGFAFGPQFALSQSLTIQITAQQIMMDQLSQAKQSPLDDTSTNRVHKKPVNDSQAAHDREIPVVYASKRNAKTLRDRLDGAGYLEKVYRMGPANVDGEELIAIPVASSFLIDFAKEERDGNTTESDDSGSWASLVQHTGKRQMALSSAAFASMKGSVTS